MKAFCCIAVLAGFMFWCINEGTTADPKPATIQLQDDTGTAILVTGLSMKEFEALQAAKWTQEQWTALLAVYVDRGAGKDRKDQTAMLGTYAVAKGMLRFEPRFPLCAACIIALCSTQPNCRIAQGGKTNPLKLLFLYRNRRRPPLLWNKSIRHARICQKISPKFYLHFSAPMSRGEAYANIHLLDADGKPVEHAFLELEQELWDPAMKRFTLLIDPGRIKQGLKPRRTPGQFSKGQDLYACCSTPVERWQRRAFEGIVQEKVSRRRAGREAARSEGLEGGRAGGQLDQTGHGLRWANRSTMHCLRIASGSRMSRKTASPGTSKSARRRRPGVFSRKRPGGLGRISL